MDIGALLESCNFGLFWKLMRNEYQPSDSPDEKFANPFEVQKAVKQVAGFEDAVRRCKPSLDFITTLRFSRLSSSQCDLPECGKAITHSSTRWNFW